MTRNNVSTISAKAFVIAYVDKHLPGWRKGITLSERDAKAIKAAQNSKDKSSLGSTAGRGRNRDVRHTNSSAVSFTTTATLL
jgi:hypothetical protein